MKKTLFSLVLILSLLTNAAIAQETDNIETDIKEQLKSFYKGVDEAIKINNTTLLKACFPTITEITEFMEANNTHFPEGFEVDDYINEIEKRFKIYQNELQVLRSDIKNKGFDWSTMTVSKVIVEEFKENLIKEDDNTSATLYKVFLTYSSNGQEISIYSDHVFKTKNGFWLLDCPNYHEDH